MLDGRLRIYGDAMMNEKIIKENIEREKAGLDYYYEPNDRLLLDKMFREINEKLGTNIHYLAEVDAYNIHGAGEIMGRYFNLFYSDSIRAYLIPQLVTDKIPRCAEIALDAYLAFRSTSNRYFIPGGPSNAYIYVRYDNAFFRLKPKHIKNELVKLARDPMDAANLPMTMKMLASWRIPEIKNILLSYLDYEQVPPEAFGIYDISRPENVNLLQYYRRDLLFCAIFGLKYYPSKKTADMIQQLLCSSDKDIQAAAKKTAQYMEKQLQ